MYTIGPINYAPPVIVSMESSRQDMCLWKVLKIFPKPPFSLCVPPLGYENTRLRNPTEGVCYLASGIPGIGIPCASLGGRPTPPATLAQKKKKSASCFAKRTEVHD